MVEKIRFMEGLCCEKRDTLLFSGGGLKTFAFCGALERLYALRKDRGSGFRVFIGVSAGAALSMCLALGRSPTDAYRLLRDDSVLAAVNKQSLSLGAVFAGGGLLERAPVARVLASWLSAAGLPVDVSFRDFKNSTGLVLRTAACTVDKGPPRILVIDDVTYPNLPVLRGILASMAVPFVFDPVEVDGRLCVDPGVVNNLCLFCCLPERTIAFLSGESSYSKGSAAAALSRLNFLWKAEARVHSKRIVIVRMPPLPDHTYHLFRVGDGSDEAVERLLQQGRDATDTYAVSRAILGLVTLVVAGVFVNGDLSVAD